MKYSILVGAVLLVASLGQAGAQTYDLYGAHAPAQSAYMRSQGNTGVAANGRCGGVSYGTGARSCGTATGGPVGGLSSRN